MTSPDFESMTSAEDFERYFNSTDDHSAFIRWMQQTGRGAPDGEIRVDTPENIPMELTAVRLPKATIQRLDQLAGNDKAGRSGLIRLAVDELLARIDHEAA